MNQILDKAYQGLVRKASPTGLLPIWNKWVDKKAVAKLGFSYNLTRAKAILAAAGYKDTDGDGYVENKDGSDIRPTIRVPERMVGLDDGDPGHRREREGRRDQGHAWLPGLRNAGRRPRSRTVRPRPGQRQAVLQHAVDVLPVHLPAADPGEPDDGELRAVPNQKAWNLTQLLDKTPSSDPKAYKAVMSQPRRCSCRTCPRFPLWYNGMWAMFNTKYWTNYPSATGREVHAYGLEQLLADDEHRHAHASEAGQVETAPMDTRHPSRRPAGRGVAFTADVVEVEARWGGTLHGRS